MASPLAREVLMLRKKVSTAQDKLRKPPMAPLQGAEGGGERG